MNLLLIVSFLPLILFILNFWWIDETKNSLQGYYPKVGRLIFFYLSQIIYLHILFYILLLIFYFQNELKRITKNIFRNLHLSIRKVYYSCLLLKNYSLENSYQTRNFTIQLFYRILLAIYLIAFSSILYQIALITDGGLIPFKEFVSVTYAHEGISSFYTYPSFYWISQANWFIYLIVLSSILTAIIGLFCKRKTLPFFFLWSSYLSIVTFGREFFQFPWDTFLLEIGFLTIFASYFTEKYNYLPRLILFTFIVLFFRQWFSMGMTKLVDGDATWYNLTYMKYYWINHPSPSPVALWMYHLPMWMQKIFTFFALLIEMAIPVALLMGRKGRIIAFFFSLFISLMIEINGNFGFFNILTASLGLWCLDDHFFRKKLDVIEKSVFKSNFKSSLTSAILIIVLFFNFHYIFLMSFEKHTKRHFLNCVNYSWTNLNRQYEPRFLRPIGQFITHFRIVSPHGVFKGIPRIRQKIEVYYLKENNKWQLLNFKKGTNPSDFSFSAPNMNRLPFHTFYQAYDINWLSFLHVNPNSSYISHWMVNLLNLLLEKNKSIETLIDLPEKRNCKLRILKREVDYNSHKEIILDEFIVSNKHDVIEYAKKYNYLSKIINERY